ncbi:restriction endonuclease subunit S [Absicoccus porci]|uniref:Restriction endonuclease subunit S n=1 Tax=Absicoccus porci TaxID=2486576 RepID=A0A3N0I2T7_9FIRM|nr:restriction endonuclease subunit S [Absicoccus porci]RNM31313.1 restriction endonuclease subunit S [Absicoccus porci]
MAREMKDSGIEWVKRIPKEWQISSNSHLFSFEKKIVGNEWTKTQLLSLTKKGIVTKNINDEGGKQPESFSTYQQVHKKQLVMCLFDLDVSAVFSGVSNYDGMISPAYKVFSINQSLLYPKYIDYYFQAIFINRNYVMYSKSLRKTIDTDNFMSIKTIVPPLSEQQKIADYLDEKVKEIDNAIEKTKETIELYKKYKQAIITEAVTKGLDLNAEMKDSGIEWAGKIPVNWSIRKGKYILNLLNRCVEENSGVVTCFRDGQVTLRENRRTEGFTNAVKEIGYQGVKPGDLVVHGMDGFAGAIGISDSIGKMSPIINVLDSNQNKKYLMYYLRSMAFKNVFLATATGIRERSCDLRWNKLANLEYLIPPLPEQQKIADFLDKKCIYIDSLIENKNNLLKEIENYKKSLIYEYVTGKKEVK